MAKRREIGQKIDMTSRKNCKVGLNALILIIILNINGINTLIKRQRLGDWI